MLEQTKEKILNALEDKKEFDVTWTEQVTYSKIIIAKDEDEVRDRFDMGDLCGENKDICDNNYEEESLEIEEV